MGQAVNRVLTRFGLEQQLWLGRLAGEWARYAGAPVAAHTRPGSFDKTAGTLCVFVDSSVWLSELKRYGQQQLLANLQRDFPQVKTVRLQADPGK